MNADELGRYNRHIILPEIGIEGQNKLKSASVLVIGAGGLGCPLLLYLAAAGVGVIGIVDDDKVDVSNLQRQVLYSVDDIGLSKAIQAKKKLNALNPLITIHVHNLRIDKANVLEIMKDYDIVVDGSDNFSTRYLINDACIILNKPLVFGSIFKFEGQVSVFNYKDGPTYRCLYSEPPKEGEVPNCSEIGVLGVLPGIIGTLQATEVIKIITGIGEVLSGRLLLFDALSMQFNALSFSLVKENKNINELIDYDEFCGVLKADAKSVTMSELNKIIEQKEEIQLIDVREEAEFEKNNIGGVLIPLGQLAARYMEVKKGVKTVLICQSGARSLKALKFLEEKGFDKLYNLKGGLSGR